MGKEGLQYIHCSAQNAALFVDLLIKYQNAMKFKKPKSGKFIIQLTSFLIDVDMKFKPVLQDTIHFLLKS